MSHSQLLVDTYRFQNQMLAWHVADFSDAELLIRPATGANHAAWHLGHLSAVTTHLINDVSPGAMPALPAGFGELYSGDGAKRDEGFARKPELLERFSQTTDAASAWVQSLTEADLSRPTPEYMQMWAPTVGRLAYALISHAGLHVGQIQVIRRALGKPVLF